MGFKNFTLEDAYENIDFPPEIPKCMHQCYACKYKYGQMDLDEFPCDCDESFDLHLHRAESEGVFDNLSENEIETSRNIADPVRWMYKEFGVEMRWYQALMARCSSRRKVARLGRRSGKSFLIAMDILWRAITKSGNTDTHRYDIIVVAPLARNITRIWDYMMEILHKSDTFKDTIERSVSSPHRRIELSNGTVIQGITAGTGEKKQDMAARGEDAHYIYIDEADYLDRGSLASILAIVASHPDVGIFMSSTPTGARDSFYSYCTDKALGFKEFHFPSYCSPVYSQKTDNFFRSSLSALEYEHEIDAEFGSDESGLFNPADLELCFEAYRYSYRECSPKNPEKRPRICGIDWNATEGFHVVIVEWLKSAKKFKLVFKAVYDVTQNRQIPALEKIIDVLTKWKVDFVYADYGAGELHVEYLQRYGQENPRTKLDKIVKGIRYQSKVEVKNPLSKEIDRKTLKPLMINLTVRRCENIELAFPIEERHNASKSLTSTATHTLETQMLNFRIDRITPSGNPVYQKTYDHTLMAYCSAIYGFIVEFTNILADQMYVSHRVTVLRSSKDRGKEDFVRPHEISEKAGNRMSMLGGPSTKIMGSSSAYHPRKQDIMRKGRTNRSRLGVGRRLNI